MSSGYMKVLMLGGLGADPTVNYTQAGQAVMNFRMAVTETRLDKDKNKVEHTEWVSCVMWGQRAESLSKYLVKGSQVFVEGKIRSSSYEDKDGNKRYKTEVVINDLYFAGGKRGGDGGDAGSYDGDDGGGQRAQGKPSGGGYGRQGGNSGSQGGGRSQGAPPQQQRQQRAPAPPPEDDFSNGYGSDDSIPF